MRVCAWLAVAGALPTVLWRVLVGFGLTLGTPEWWRTAQELPGSGTAYVLTLSSVQLAAALATLLLIHPRGDRVPRWSPITPGARLPASVVGTIALTGAAILVWLCVASAINWDAVDPFSDADGWNGWAVLARSCYAVAPLWPVFLTATTIGYLRGRRAD